VPASSNIAQFGRKRQLTIQDGSGNQLLQFGASDWLPEQLQVTFDTYQSVSKHLWQATISIYNLNSPTTNIVLKQGMKVKLEAGYMKGPYGTIFEGMAGCWIPSPFCA
jgi:hypothetical protein